MPVSEQDDYLRGLQRMADQIAANFSGLDSAQAARSVAEHLRRFWNPGMRRDLAQAVAEGRVVVSGPVREAIKDLAVGAD